MLISLVFVLLLAPVPSFLANIGVKRNSTKPTPHAINLSLLPKPVAADLNPSKLRDASHSPFSTAKLTATHNAQKPSRNTAPASSTVTVVISQSCGQKDSPNATGVQEVELNIQPGSPLIMKHQISLDISACADGCGAQTEELKGRVELLEKQLTALQKICADKKSELAVETVAMKVPESGTIKQETIKHNKADKMVFGKKMDPKKELKKDQKVEPTTKPTTNKPTATNSTTKDQNVLLKDEKEQEQAKRGKTTVLKTEPDKQVQADHLFNISTNQEMKEEPSTKQEKLKHMPSNNSNITQNTEKKTNRTSKVLSSSANEAKPSTDANTVSANRNHPQSNVNSSTTTRAKNVKKLLQSHEVAEEETAGQRMVEKQGNRTVSFETETKTQLQGNTTLPKEVPSAKKKVEKYVNITNLTEKDKKLFQVNITLLGDGGASSKKNVEKHDISKSSEKEETQFKTSTILLKDGSSGKKKTNSHLSVLSPEKDRKLPQKATHIRVITWGKHKLENHGNVTVPSTKDKKSPHDNKTATVREVPSSRRKVEKYVVVPLSTEKGKKPHSVNTTLVKEIASALKNLEKRRNGTSSTEKDKKLHQVDVTAPLKDATLTNKNHQNVTTTTEKDMKLHQVDVTAPLKDKTLGNSKHQNVTITTEKDKKVHQVSVTAPLKNATLTNKKHQNMTTTTEKDKKLHQVETTLSLKDVTLTNKKHQNVTITTEKDKKVHQVDVTASLKDKTLGNTNHQNVTITTEKDKKVHQVDVTAPLKDKTLGNIKHQNVTITTEKDKKVHQVDVTAPLKDTTLTNKKHQNITSTTEKDKKLHQVSVALSKGEASGKRKMEKQVNVITLTGKNKPQLQGNATLLKEGKGKVERHGNVTVLPDRKVHVTLFKEEKKVTTIKVQNNATTAVLQEKATGKERNTTSKTKILKEGGASKKASSGISITHSTRKDKKVHVSGITPLKEAAPGRKKVGGKLANVTVSTEKDKKMPQTNVTLLKEDTSAKEKVDVVTVSEEKGKKQLLGGKINSTSVEAKTTKLKDVSSVETHNITATGFMITWETPQGAFKNFTVTSREVLTGSKDEDFAQGAGKSQDGIDKDNKGNKRVSGNEAEIHASNRTSKVYSGRAERRTVQKFSQVLPGTARSLHFTNLHPQTRYLVSLYGSRPGGLYKLHRLFVSTGPEPPTDLVFSNVTETSLSVSWAKPRSVVTGFRVTYTNTGNGDTGSISVDSQLSHVLISKLSAGSSYEISIRSVLETLESEPTTASITTVADPPANLQVVNITDTKALLIWKPPQAKVDHYILSYSSGKSPNVTVTVMLSGSSVEHQLRGLHRLTLYTLKLSSQISSHQSRSTSTTFTTTSGVKLQTVTPSEVTFSSAVISWKAPHLDFRSYRLMYQHGRSIKEVVLNPTVTRYELTGLAAFSNYTVKVDGERDGQYINIVSTAFTTAQVPFPHPTDCLQVQLNGVKESGEAEVYPDGKDGEPAWVYCDMDTDGGGWTVFQRRVDGSTDFFRGWNDYRKGFGFLSAEFWLGNDILHSLTSLTPVTLRVDLRSGNNSAYAHYSSFTVATEADHYALALSGYSGTAGDSMKYHNGRPFSTKDKDPNPLSIHCAQAYMGGWWYKNCYKANLNGLYSTFTQNQGVVWIDWKGKDISIPFTEMKLRPASARLITLQE